jgi:hypothetical protein
MENTTASDLFTKTGPPMPTPPPTTPTPTPPLPDWTDPFYPEEELNETAAAAVPTVESVAPDASSCVLRSTAGVTATAVPGELLFGSWTVLAIIPPARGSPVARVALERRFVQWALIVVTGTAGEVTRLRKPVGDLGKIHTPTYAFPSDYFVQAASDPNDYIGERQTPDRFARCEPHTHTAAMGL